jgi:hypothetical protein
MSLEKVHAQLRFDDAVLAQIANEAAKERAEQRRIAALSPYFRPRLNYATGLTGAVFFTAIFFVVAFLTNLIFSS